MWRVHTVVRSVSVRVQCGWLTPVGLYWQEREGVPRLDDIGEGKGR